MEGLRTDSLMLGSFRVSQLIAAASVLAALALWLVLRQKYKGRPLVITYPVPEKQNGKTQIWLCTWPLTQTPPTDSEIKAKIEQARQTASHPPAPNGPTAYVIAFGAPEAKTAKGPAEPAKAEPAPAKAEPMGPTEAAKAEPAPAKAEPMGPAEAQAEAEPAKKETALETATAENGPRRTPAQPGSAKPDEASDKTEQEAKNGTAD